MTVYSFKQLIETINNFVEKEVEQIGTHKPEGLFSPITYTLKMGGKRIRPALTLMGYNLFAPDIEKALPAAFAIEVFHNFTLLHDDVMDKSNIRRGGPTVHHRFNENAAILSGDAMSIMAYEYLIRTDTPRLQELFRLFTSTAMDICKGQQYDMEFEGCDDVSVGEYLEMIRLKTAVLLACSTKAGALVANAPAPDCEALYDFALNLGLAFQLQDDFLDVYGDTSVFGKKIGGDIVANKKTFLLLSALNRAQGVQKEELNHWLTKPVTDWQEKIDAVKAIYDRLGVRELSDKKMGHYYQHALNALDCVDVDKGKKAGLLEIAQKMMVREK